MKNGDKTPQSVTILPMLRSDLDPWLDARASSRDTTERRARGRGAAAENPQTLLPIRPLPAWARLGDAASAAFFAGAGLAHLDLILHAGEDGAEPPFSGALRQRLALKAATTCARLTQLREDEAALRDAEHLAGVGGETSPAGRLHRLWRLFASRCVKFDAATLAVAADHVGTPSAMDAQGLAAALRDAMTKADEPLVAAARVSEAAMHCLAAVPAIDAEIFVLWLADVALAQKLGWKAPIPLLATAVAHPALRRGPNDRRTRPSDRDWPHALASAYALAAGEAIDLAGALSRQTQKLLDAAPKLRAKGAERVIDMLLADNSVAPARAARAAGLSDRASRRLFDRLVELYAVRELSGRSSFRLYGL